MSYPCSCPQPPPIGPGEIVEYWPAAGERPPHGRLAALAVPRAEAIIEARVAERLSVRDLARAVGVSVRSLRRAFQHLRGHSPAEAIRRARLLGVREDLLTAGPRERVTDVAMRWGFSHLGRFSGVYAAHFGELPSETLRRSMARARQGENPEAVRP